MVGANFALFRRARADDRLGIRIHLNADFGTMRVFELAELALDSYSAIGDVHLDALWQRNRFFTYAGHVKSS